MHKQFPKHKPTNMNRQVLFLILLGAAMLCNPAYSQQKNTGKPASDASNAATPAKAHLKLDVVHVDFGEIPVGKSKVIEVGFTNTGTKPLIITDTYTNCGCTGVEFPKEPFMPGKSGKLTISYDADEEGFFNKTITIYSNADNKKETIKIQGMVVKPEK